MIKLSGSVVNGPESSFMGVVSSMNDMAEIVRGRYVLLCDDGNKSSTAGFAGVLSSKPVTESDSVQLQDWCNYLTDGDVVYYDGEHKRIIVLYRVKGNANSFLVTERCSSNCLMCSQPPKAANDEHLYDLAIRTVDFLSRETATAIGITGGEPFVNSSKFLTLLQRINYRLPDTSVHVLTNGRMFAYPSLVRDVANVNHRDVMFGIPLYSSVATTHDFVVQATGAFDQTIRGILNAKRAGLKVEIRVVLHKQTIPELRLLAQFISRNLPMVDHVALMGLEHQGHVKMNQDALYIDPMTYQSELAAAVNELKYAGPRVSIYNLQLCILDPSIRKFAVKSISDWKNDYLPVCSSCEAKSECGGFFTWNMPFKSAGIHPLQMA
jgi:His-Xaa-Ser system radical SAM maturase HxsC